MERRVATIKHCCGMGSPRCSAILRTSEPSNLEHRISDVARTCHSQTRYPQTRACSIVCNSNSMMKELFFIIVSCVTATRRQYPNAQAAWTASLGRTQLESDAADCRLGSRGTANLPWSMPSTVITRTGVEGVLEALPVTPNPTE